MWICLMFFEVCFDCKKFVNFEKVIDMRKQKAAHFESYEKSGRK